jgi:hypothetical protein
MWTTPVRLRRTAKLRWQEVMANYLAVRSTAA